MGSHGELVAIQLFNRSERKPSKRSARETQEAACEWPQSQQESLELEIRVVQVWFSLD